MRIWYVSYLDLTDSISMTVQQSHIYIFFFFQYCVSFDELSIFYHIVFVCAEWNSCFSKTKAQNYLRL